jgi:Integrase core domain
LRQKIEHGKVVDPLAAFSKQATVHRYHHDNHDQLKQHLADFINAYNFARCLKALKRLTLYEFICKC